MLILSRKQGETICIGNEIEVQVLSITGNRVSLGVAGPTTAKAAPGERPKATASLSPGLPKLVR
ncbi:carbon storage regulator [Candidatus Pacearchaeota archaeon]|nr:carbon storage regulator [Candidatus Pacearchaeota archaeon]